MLDLTKLHSISKLLHYHNRSWITVSSTFQYSKLTAQTLYLVYVTFQVMN